MVELNPPPPTFCHGRKILLIARSLSFNLFGIFSEIKKTVRKRKKNNLGRLSVIYSYLYCVHMFVLCPLPLVFYVLFHSLTHMRVRRALRQLLLFLHHLATKLFLFIFSEWHFPYYKFRNFKKKKKKKTSRHDTKTKKTASYILLDILLKRKVKRKVTQ